MGLVIPLSRAMNLGCLSKQAKDKVSDSCFLSACLEEGERQEAHV